MEDSDHSRASLIAQPAEGLGWGWRVLGVVALAGLLVAAYLPAVRGGFIWDDDSYIQNNSNLRSVEGLGHIWFEVKSEPQYYPMTHTSFWVEYHLWGLTPLGYHIDNLLLHWASAILLWGILRRLGFSGAWVMAAIFAVHPVQVESVAWATERKNILSGTLFFASLLLYLRWLGFPGGARKKWMYAAALAFFVLALLSKSVTSVMPAAVLVILWWKRGRIGWRDVGALLPFFVCGIAMGSVTGWMERTHVGAVGPEFDFTITQRFAIAGRAVWFYAGKLLWPTRLTFSYARWNMDVGQRPWLLLFPAAAGGALAALALLSRRRGRGGLAAGLLFVGGLFPALGFVNVYPMRYSFVADHFQYLACVALIVPVVFGVGEILRRRGFGATGKALAAVVILGLAALTWRQGHIYRDRESLWVDTIAKNPGGFLARSGYGDLLWSEGDDRGAEREYLASLENKPDNFVALISLAAIEKGRGDYAVALGLDKRALGAIGRVFAPERLPYFIIGARYEDMAEEYRHLPGADPAAIRAALEQAELNYRKALARNAEDESAILNLGQLLTVEGRLDEATELLRRGAAIDPDSVSAHTDLGNALLAKGDAEGAVEEYEAVLRLQPDNAKAHNNLGAVYARMGIWDRAIVEFQEAVKIDPGFALARRNLDAAQAAKSRGQ